MGVIDPLLDWILYFSPFIGIVIISLVMALLTTVIYKFASNQKKIKKIKEQMKELQKKMKTIPKDQPEKMMAINSAMMKLNGPMMKESFKSTFYTIIPSLLILAWMSANLAFYPLYTDQPFTITADFNEGVTGVVTMSELPEGFDYINGAEQEIIDFQAIWEVKSESPGTYTTTINFLNKGYNQDILIVEKPERKYSNPEQIIRSGGLNKITVSNKKIKPFEGAPIVGGLNWLWSYILITIIMSSVLRKLLKVY